MVVDVSGGVNKVAGPAPGAVPPPVREAAVLILLGLMLFGWRLGSHDLWPTDEPRFGLVAREMRDRGDPVVLSLNNHLYTEKPPLFFWAVNGFAAFRGGVDEWAARLPSAASGLMALLVILYLGESLYDRRTGFLGAIVFATSVQILERARWASIDMTLTLFVLLAVALLWRAAASGSTDGEQGGAPGSRLAARLAWVAMALATLAKGPVGLALPLLVVVPALFLLREGRALRRLCPASGILLYLAVTLAWFAPFAMRIGPEQAMRILTRQTVTRYVDAWNGRQPFWFYAWRFPVGFFPWIIFLPPALTAAIREREPGERRAGVLLLTWVGAILLFFSFSTGKRGVYIMPLYPAAALLVARVFARAAPEGDRGAQASIAARRALLRACAAWSAVALLVAGAVVTIGPRRAPELRAAAWILGAVLAGGGLAAIPPARGGRSVAAAGAVAMTMTLVLLISTETVFPYVNRHLNLRGFAEQVREQLRPEVPLATTEEKRDAWVFYSGRFVTELDTRTRLLSYLAQGPVRDLLIEDEEFVQVRDELPAGTVELLAERVSGRPYHMLRLPERASGDPP